MHLDSYFLFLISLLLPFFLYCCKAPRTASDIDAIERKFIIIIIKLTQPAVYPIKAFLSRTLTIVR